ncbi:MAG: nucleotidyltransferase [Fimbriimonadaceae bacterium]|nr:nucleotidyltransferase [Fimbriimonadaceae bacterium]
MPDFIRILRSLTEEGVEYALVGGFAACLYGNRRSTVDLDICVAIEPTNLLRLANAIQPFQPRLRPGGPLIRLDDKPLGGSFSRIYTVHGQIDVLQRLAGPWSTTDIIARAERITIGDFEVRIASLNDLIVLKEAAARPHDLEDASNLRYILESRSSQGPPRP